MPSTRPSRPPLLVTCDPDGHVVEHPELEAVGVDGPRPAAPALEEWIPLPDGSDLLSLPGRRPVGLDPTSGELVELDEPGFTACSAFLAPAWTRGHVPAYRTGAGAPPLPLFAYALLGWADGGFWTTGVRVDEDARQDPWTFDEDRIRSSAFREIDESADNRVMQQLTRCALEYGCRAAQNFFLHRHEAPLPVSVACNAQCVGCISLQPDGAFRASHERLTRQVSPREVVEVALRHWSRVPDGVVSFGQGCEGEPLLEGQLLVESVREMRRAHPEGTINLNTNASRPDVVRALAEAGLDSMRVSLNSARSAVYEAYYRPRGYGLEDVELSIREMKRHGKRVSTNLLYFPGVTDTDAEVEAFSELVRRSGVDMVQLRNLNVDPELYAAALPAGVLAPGLGVRGFLRELSGRAPGLAWGYFNPTRARWAELTGRPA